MLHFSKLTAATFAFGSLLIGIANAQTVLRSADTHPDGYPTVEAVKYMGDLVKQRTNGRYRSRSNTRPSSARRRTRSSRRGSASST